MAAMDQATPMPRKTFTALLPVTFPMEASAYWSCVAATLLANVSAKERWGETLRKHPGEEGSLGTNVNGNTWGKKIMGKGIRYSPF